MHGNDDLVSAIRILRIFLYSNFSIFENALKEEEWRIMWPSEDDLLVFKYKAHLHGRHMQQHKR